MKLLGVILCTLAASPALASTLTYEIDLSKSPELSAEIIESVCGLSMTLHVNSKGNLSDSILRKTHTSDPAKARIQKIETSTGGIGGGQTQEPYAGDYQTHVSIVRTSSTRAYKEGVFTRVEITTYGNPKAPKAFQIESDLLNYRSSAELAEGLICSKLSYKLK